MIGGSENLLAGKAFVITGAGSGIGAACAEGVARQGGQVLVNDIDRDGAERTVRLIMDAGGAAQLHVGDVSHWIVAGEIVAACLDAFGSIDGLVNNAALFTMAPVTRTDPVRARQLVEVNVLGPINCTGQAIGHMVAQGSGSIVNLVSGAHLGLVGCGIYGATKGAVASMVYSWALELADTGVRVNGLSPFAKTSMTDGGDAMQNEEERRIRDSQLPEPRVNSPVLEYLLSDLSTGVNGQIVRIDKGELQLYAHPALLLPSLHRDEWTAQQVAEAFEANFMDRLAPCGVMGTDTVAAPVESGYWNRVKQQDRY